MGQISAFGDEEPVMTKKYAIKLLFPTTVFRLALGCTLQYSVHLCTSLSVFGDTYPQDRSIPPGTILQAASVQVVGSTILLGRVCSRFQLATLCHWTKNRRGSFLGCVYLNTR